MCIKLKSVFITKSSKTLNTCLQHNLQFSFQAENKPKFAYQQINRGSIYWVTFQFSKKVSSWMFLQLKQIHTTPEHSSTPMFDH